MNIGELIAKLQELAEEHGEETEVRLATQPSYPFEYGIEEEVVAVALDEDEAEDSTIVYIAECGQLGYLPGAVSRALGWKD